MLKFNNLFLYFFFSLVILNVGIWYTVSYRSNDGQMFISFLNIGQGDAIFIQAPNGAQMLMDGGPGRKVLSELGGVMPFYDKTIDSIVITNPDADHIAGFIDVLSRYKIDYVFEPGTVSKTDTSKEVEESINEEGSEKIIMRRGMEIVLDKENNVYLQILFPDKDVKTFSTNDGSMIAKLVYGNTSVLLQGDAPQKSEKYILSLNKEVLDVDILKVGHHGSRTSTAKEYVVASTPDYAVISSGVDNRYGHPHKETLETLNFFNVITLRTDTDGRITFVSDGKKFRLKKTLF